MEVKQRFSPVYMKGSIWDDGGKTEIVQILISHDHSSINSIQFVYVVDGKLLHSNIHGKVTGENRFACVGFDYPREYLVSVSGLHDQNGRLVSITFGTNIHTYGPFGRADDPRIMDYKFAYYFSPKSSFGGFHGSVDGPMLRIGVYIRPVGSPIEFMTKN